MTIAHRASHSRQRSSLASPTTKQRPFDLFYPFFFYLNGKNKDTLSQDTYTHRILKTSRHGDCRAVQGKMTQREGVFQWKVFADAVVPGPQGVFHPNQGQELRNILGGRRRGLTNQTNASLPIESKCFGEFGADFLPGSSLLYSRAEPVCFAAQGYKPLKWARVLRKCSHFLNVLKAREI